jgi:hypothetical protein
MRRTDKHLSDQECRDILLEIVRMVIDTYAKPIRKGFEKSSRMGQCGFDLVSILRNHKIISPGEQNQQERMEL